MKFKVSSLDSEIIMGTLDLDNDGKLSFKEFIMAMGVDDDPKFYET